MNILPILLEPDERLHQACEPVTVFDGGTLVLAWDMLATMYAAKGVGLAAPQVGRNIRMIVMDCSDKRNEPVVMINPVIDHTEGEAHEGVEGCLSFPGQHHKVKRFDRVWVKYQDERGHAMCGWANFLWAVCVQHEIDHLDGITFDQRAAGLIPSGGYVDHP